MRFLTLALGALVLLAVALAVNTARVQPAPRAAAATDLPALDEKALAQHLSAAVRVPTVTYTERDRVDWSQFGKLHEVLKKQFPRVHKELKRETVAQRSLLFTWRGSDASMPPILLLAHQDVVPIEPGTEKSWTHPPFAGEIADGFVWGRGTLDDKASLVAQLEAAEWLLAHGFKPKRTLYFAFGHDEEISGTEGATNLAKELAKRRVKAEFSLDEGGSITVGVVPNVKAPVASIMTAEKGYVSFRLTAHDPGGHSSRPGPTTAIGRLSRAVARLQAHPFRPHLTAPVRDMLTRLAPEYPLAQRVAVANLWLLRPLVVRRMTEGRITNALVRTTTAPTIFSAGIKDNVLPSEASAVVNFRIAPDESIADVERHVRRVMDDDGIELAVLDFASEPSTPASDRTPGFQLLERTVNEVFPEAVVSAGLVIGATDNRHYGAVREQRYNFAPLVIGEEDLSRVHGSNERVATRDYVRMVQFYLRLIQNAAG
ncbi:MAG TPA: M20 family peptidase [Candidatus Binatia bacterium]|nr:M20 family peptidase [Candidatus Binatia bacterium]